MLPLPVIPAAPSAGAGPFVVEVAFKGNRREFYLTEDATLSTGEYVIVEVERGQDLGRVRSVGGVAARETFGVDATPAPVVLLVAEVEGERCVVAGEGVVGAEQRLELTDRAAESVEERLARRTSRWTPMSLSEPN